MIFVAAALGETTEKVASVGQTVILPCYDDGTGASDGPVSQSMSVSIIHLYSTTSQ